VKSTTAKKDGGRNTKKRYPIINMSRPPKERVKILIYSSFVFWLLRNPCILVSITSAF